MPNGEQALLDEMSCNSQLTPAPGRQKGNNSTAAASLQVTLLLLLLLLLPEIVRPATCFLLPAIPLSSLQLWRSMLPA